MIEVYVNTNETLEFRIYEGGIRTQADGAPSGIVTVTITDLDTSDELAVSFATPALEAYNNTTAVVYTYTLPLSFTVSNRVLEVLWEYQINGEDAQHIDHVGIVTPYTTPDEIIQQFPEFAIDGSNPKTFDQLKEMERTVRHVIDTYCNQTFDREVAATKYVLGKDSDSLLMPRRLISYTDVSLEGTSISGYVEQDPTDHWRIRRAMISHDDAIKRDVQNLFHGKYFRENRVYAVTGDWGWRYVPNEVNLAARTLVAQRYCKEESYRQKYIKTARSADFRIEFWRPGDMTTGSVDADMILNQYRVVNAVII